MRGLAGVGAAVGRVLTFIVMPCLDEASQVGGAISSLLFPEDGEPADAHLVVVDNGSTDGTLSVLEANRGRCPERIHIFEEPRRGYVPPRRRGVEAAAEIAAAMNIAQHDVLVVQADADTIYKRGYVGAMQRAAEDWEGAIFEGATRRPLDFETAHPDYVAAEHFVDDAIEPLETVDEDDVVVDDKACAYRLSDYSRWGGLFEESSADGDQIHAETTRMFIRAKLSAGARKIRVNQAGAASSRRRVLENPRYQFATMGFPRELSWASRRKADWRCTEVDAFARAVLDGGEAEAVYLRQAHLIALFRFLPALILKANSQESDLLEQDDVRMALSHLALRKLEDLSARPGSAIIDVLRLIDTHPNLFRNAFSNLPINL